jgi:ribonuclease HI
MIEGWFDGVCEPYNPGGHAAFGILLRVDGNPVVARSGYVGFGDGMSNNVAEFSGFIALMIEVKKFPGIAMIRGDSKLVINTLSGKWKVKQGLYVPYFTQARNLFEVERERIGIEWISRDDNGECDQLSKAELKDRGIRLRIQPSDGARRGSHGGFPTTPTKLKAAGYEIRHEAVECRGCKALIDFYNTPLGKVVPVDHGTAMPHFKTCPNADQFRKKKG